MSSSLSFKFSKVSRSKVSDDKPLESLTDDYQGDDASRRPSKRQKIKSLDSSGFNAVNETSGSRSHTIIIPALKNTLKFDPSVGPDVELDKLARRALQDDANKFMHERLEKTGEQNDIYKNQLKIDLPSKNELAEPPEVTDYESVPVDCFGTALLRGLGWQEGFPIGRTSKKTVKPWITEPRPTGLGLGTALSKPSSAIETNEASGKMTNKEKGELGFKKGAFLRILKAKTDNYGLVVSIDNDNARIFVKLPKRGDILNLSQYAVELVLQSEYERATSDGSKPSKNEKRFRVNMEEMSRSHSNHKNIGSWLQTDLKVRIIDHSIYKGKYFKQKVIITEILSPETCNCLAENGKLLEDLHFVQLESVIPRLTNNANQSKVMVLRGSSKGQVGGLLERDSKKNRAVVRILTGESEGEILTTHFDDICEYVGDVL